MGGVQAETTLYFVVEWVLFEYSSFDHIPYKCTPSLGSTVHFHPS